MPEVYASLLQRLGKAVPDHVSEDVSECGSSQFLTFPHMTKSDDRENFANC